MGRYATKSEGALTVSSRNAVSSSGPGSNGYMYRRMFSRAGSFSWAAPGDGRIKIQALGAGGGAGDLLPGAGGAYAEKELMVSKGDLLLITIGEGGAGKPHGFYGLEGGTTSIMCSDLNLAMVLTGGGLYDHTVSTYNGGTATGVDLTYQGGDVIGLEAFRNTGGASSGSPRGPGFSSEGAGGSGWGGPSLSDTGASSHHRGRKGNALAACGLTTKGGVRYDPSYGYGDPNGESAPFWDLEDADGGGGALGEALEGGNGGIAAGGAGSTATLHDGGQGGLGAGGGAGNKQGGDGGNGAGGGASRATNGTDKGGNGGDGLVLIFFNLNAES